MSRSGSPTTVASTTIGGQKFVVTHHPNSQSAAVHWKMQEHITKAASLVEQLSKVFHHKQPDLTKCNDLLKKIKIELVNFQLVPPFFEEKQLAEAQLAVARQAFELAVFINVTEGDDRAFERNFAQLKPFYFDYAEIMKPSEHQWAIIGLNLMGLLAANKLSSFHTELELIPYQQHENKYVQFPIHLEQYLMEGSYNKVLSVGKDIPLQHYSHFMKVLEETVRDKIAHCSEKAYDFIPLADGKRLLMLKSDAEAKDFATKRGWIVTQDKITFPKGKDTSLEIPSHHVMAQTLHYATELERIV